MRSRLQATCLGVIVIAITVLAVYATPQEKRGARDPQAESNTTTTLTAEHKAALEKADLVFCGQIEKLVPAGKTFWLSGVFGYAFQTVIYRPTEMLYGHTILHAIAMHHAITEPPVTLENEPILNPALFHAGKTHIIAATIEPAMRWEQDHTYRLTTYCKPLDPQLLDEVRSILKTR